MLRKHAQPDYRLCKQTVTVYHREGLTRQVFDKAYYEYGRTLDTAAGADTGGASCLLVIPCREQVIFPGDKVVLGVGPKLTSWAALNPTAEPTLSVLREVKCKFLGKSMCHCEGR